MSISAGYFTANPTASAASAPAISAAPAQAQQATSTAASATSGYYAAQAAAPASAPTAISPPAATSTTGYYGAQPVTVQDTYVQTSNSDPYLGGMRTGMGAMAAMKGAKTITVMARWNHILHARTITSRAANSAARAAGRKVGTMAVKTKQMQAARTITAKANLTDNVHVGLGGALRASFFSIGNVARAIGGSALFAIPSSIISNMMDFAAGRINAQQRNSLIVADSAAYTVTGAGSSLLGGALGSTFLGPGIGTILGIGAGIGLGYVYEKFIRPTWGAWVQKRMYPTAAPAPAPVATPAPAPTPPVAPTINSLAVK